MRYIKLFESFSINEAKDEANVSIKKAKKRTVEVSEGKISTEDQKYEDDLSKLFKKLVPSQGVAETVEGEMVRAVMRVFFRYFNDGDYFFRGYGKETAAPSVNWLKTQSPLAKEMKSIWAAAQRNAPSVKRGGKYSSYIDEYDEEKDGYLKGIRKAVKAVVDYVEGKKGEYTPNDKHNSR